MKDGFQIKLLGLLVRCSTTRSRMRIDNVAGVVRTQQ